MGHNDQSDGKRAKIGLSRRKYRRWPQKLLAKTMEDAISNGYLNYLLDPNCKKEPWPVFLYALVDELIESGENLRTTVPGFVRRHKKQQISKRPVAGSMEVLQIGMKCESWRNIRVVKFLTKNSELAIVYFVEEAVRCTSVDHVNSTYVCVCHKGKTVDHFQTMVRLVFCDSTESTDMVLSK